MGHSLETRKKISEARKGKATGKRPQWWRDRVSEGKRGVKFSAEHRANLSKSLIGRPGYWLGKKRSAEDIEKFRVSHLGKTPSIETRKRLSESVKKAKAHMKSADSSEHETIRKSFEYRLWHESVLRRDDWTCVLCKKRGGKLHVDHIKPFAYYPKLRLVRDNGRTLCVPCHVNTPTWGAGPKKRHANVSN